MSSLIIKRLLLSKPPKILSNISQLRNAGHWNHHYKPGPYPKTPEERAAAAKKYGLLVEEYEPYPEEEGYGDYPKMPDIGADSKDPYYPYDFPELRRNFNEPMHVNFELIGEDRYDISVRLRYPIWFQAMWFFGVVGGFFAIYFFLEDYKMGRPVTAKQYPGKGVVHYDFSS